MLPQYSINRDSFPSSNYSSMSIYSYTGRSVGNNDSKLMSERFPDYIRRLLDINQMDFEATYDQMLLLLSFDPSRAYISFFYRKQTKNQWARDDPAFVVVLISLLSIGSVAYATAFRRPSFWLYLWTVLYTIVVDYLFIGFITSSICCYLANNYLRQRNSHSVVQVVEWLYAFDIHSNAVFCSFMITYVIQYFFLPILLANNVISCISSNTLYSVAFLWYAYITHLGYRALPFLGNTQVFLWYPIVCVCSIWTLGVILLLFGVHINVTRLVMSFHYG